MLDIDEMGQDEIHELLHKVGYGHLGFIHEGKPCVMLIVLRTGSANESGEMSGHTTDGVSSRQ